MNSLEPPVEDGGGILKNNSEKYANLMKTINSKIQEGQRT